LLEFPDLVRVVDEIDDIFSKYAKPPAVLNNVDVFLPESVCFVSALRKGILNSTMDKDTWKYNHIFVDISLKAAAISAKTKQFFKLVKDDSVRMPKGKTMLQVSVAYRDVNTRQLDMLERLMMGSQRIEEWEFRPEQRLADSKDPQTEIRYLLEERRRNPNLNVGAHNTAAASNQARTAKIWSTFDRDFMFRFCRFAVPRKLDEQGVRTLYNHDNPMTASGDEASKEMDDLSMQLLRTRIKQEEDVVVPIKEYEDSEARLHAVKQYEKGEWVSRF